MLDDAILFRGSRKEVDAFLCALDPGDYYTYVLKRPDGTPFYVGKGTGRRVLEHELEALRESPLPVSNPFKCNAIRKILGGGGQICYVIDRVYDALDQDACLDRETALIASYGRRCDGGCLTNLAAGKGSLARRDPFSTQRHAETLSGFRADNPERSALNLFLAQFGDIGSVPIKPLSQYRNVLPAYMSPKASRNVSKRKAITLVVSAAASGLRLRPGVVVPRSFVVHTEGLDWPEEVARPLPVRAVIENGTISTILKVGLATLVEAENPEEEGLRLNDRQVAQIISTLGRDQLNAWDLL